MSFQLVMGGPQKGRYILRRLTWILTSTGRRCGPGHHVGKKDFLHRSK